MRVEHVIVRVPRLWEVDDEIKEGILDEALVCRHWGILRDEVIILGWLGRVLFKTKPPDKVLVSFIPGDAPKDDARGWSVHYIKFWSSPEELKFLSDYLEVRRHLKIPFETIYNGRV
jgi:hypothetical protein